MRVEIEVAERHINSLVCQIEGIHPDRQSNSVVLVLMNENDNECCRFDFDSIADFFKISTQELIENKAENMIQVLKKLSDEEQLQYILLCKQFQQILTLEDFLVTK